ncbi:MAG TPA: MmgE/PrpD family protein [Methylomirabilota bacterium]|jgi:2-methylcitrate dehydratase PrpD|nr:MmgE/PrpD family protein [Methylomirabilota bacterium]
MSGKPLTVGLGEFVAGLRFEDLPPPVVDKAKAVVNHAVTVALAGFGAQRTAAARRAVLAHEALAARRVGAGQGATLWGDGARVTRAGAAFANGVAVAVNNQCDSYHMLTHPGVLIVPAGLATAEGEGRTGRELLVALAAGYEVQCRCARDFIPSTPAHGFRASPVYGILGCAAATAKLLGLDAARTANAIALAASFAGSLIEGQRTGARDADFAEAQAARSGMWAAALAAEGFEGAPTALEGEGGFYHAFTGSHRGDLTYSFTGALRADLGEVVADLGRRWEFLDVKFKIYPTPGFNQPVIWLAHEMTAAHRLEPDAIERVTLEMNHLETLYPSPRFPRPPAPDGSGFGRTAYMLAYTLVTGDYPVLEDNVEDPRDAGASADARVAARVTALQKRVEILGVVGRPTFAPRLTVVLRDGRRVTGEYGGRELMWDFARDARELRRFLPGLPIAPARYDELVGAITKLDASDSVDAVLRLTLAEHGERR